MHFASKSQHAQYYAKIQPPPPTEKSKKAVAAGASAATMARWSDHSYRTEEARCRITVEHGHIDLLLPRKSRPIKLMVLLFEVRDGRLLRPLAVGRPIEVRRPALEPLVLGQHLARRGGRRSGWKPPGSRRALPTARYGRLSLCRERTAAPDGVLHHPNHWICTRTLSPCSSRFWSTACSPPRF